MIAAQDHQPERRRGVVVDRAPRCWRCKRLLAVLAARPWEIDCGRCKAKNCSAPPESSR